MNIKPKKTEIELFLENLAQQLRDPIELINSLRSRELLELYTEAIIELVKEIEKEKYEYHQQNQQK